MILNVVEGPVKRIWTEPEPEPLFIPEPSEAPVEEPVLVPA